MHPELDYTFHSMGSDIRLLIGSKLLPTASDQLTAADREKAFVLDFAHRLSRFAPDSELSALNCDPRSVVPASPLLRAAVRAGIWSAEASDGLLDPTLVDALNRIGYGRSLDGAEPAPLSEALSHAPARRSASANPRSRWRQIEVDDSAGLIRRPAGVLLDTGGAGKGLCADAVAHRLRPYARFLVDCGGDIAVGGVGAQLEPYEIEVEHPLTRRSIGTIAIGRGGIATSGVNVRIWRAADGEYAHHLLDPSTGMPAWTGLIAVTALADTALEAETLSKIALLRGPRDAREVLAAHGGVLIHDSGEVETVGRIGAAFRGGRFALASAR
jgi:FAD:protein FMN transferase